MPRPADTFHMNTARCTARCWILAVTTTSLAAAPPLAGQLVSARPASVSLTVVVPPRSGVDRGVASEGAVALLATTSNAVDFETIVSLTTRAPARIEVRLAPTWNADAGRLWIRNQRGEFEPLMSGGPAVAVDAPSVETGAPSPLRLRLESNRSHGRSSLTVPLEYRVKVGTGDEFSVWSFPSLLRIDP